MAGRMVGELFTGFLDADDKAGKASPMDLGFLTGILRQMKKGVEGSSAFTSPWRSLFNLANEDEEGYFWTEGKKYLLIFVSTGEKERRAGPDDAQADRGRRSGQTFATSTRA